MNEKKATEKQVVVVARPNSSNIVLRRDRAQAKNVLFFFQLNHEQDEQPPYITVDAQSTVRESALSDLESSVVAVVAVVAVCVVSAIQSGLNVFSFFATKYFTIISSFFVFEIQENIVASVFSFHAALDM